MIGELQRAITAHLVEKAGQQGQEGSSGSGAGGTGSPQQKKADPFRSLFNPTPTLPNKRPPRRMGSGMSDGGEGRAPQKVAFSPTLEQRSVSSNTSSPSLAGPKQREPDVI